jgi:hypothetical protein
LLLRRQFSGITVIERLPNVAAPTEAFCPRVNTLVPAVTVRYVVVLAWTRPVLFDVPAERITAAVSDAAVVVAPETEKLAKPVAPSAGVIWAVTMTRTRVDVVSEVDTLVHPPVPV